jgi:hypothetical protein
MQQLISSEQELVIVRSSRYTNRECTGMFSVVEIATNRSDSNIASVSVTHLHHTENQFSAKVVCLV